VPVEKQHSAFLSKSFYLHPPVLLSLQVVFQEFCMSYCTGSYASYPIGFLAPRTAILECSKPAMLNLLLPPAKAVMSSIVTHANKKAEGLLSRADLQVKT
jgi:hypothetical protein